MISNPLTIAHISDLHIRCTLPGPPSLPERRGRELWQRFPAFLHSLESTGVDVIALTGDLLDVPRWMVKEGFYYEYDFGWWEKAVKEDYLKLKALFSQLSIPVLLLPGNHDHPSLFRQVFGRQLEPVTIKGHTFYTFSDWSFRNSQARRLDSERKLFNSALEKGPSGQVHLQHYTIEPKIKHEYPYNYREWEEISQRILESGKVRLCLSGHYHDGAQQRCLGMKGHKTIFHTVPALCVTPFQYDLISMQGAETSIRRKALGELIPGKNKALFIDRDGTLAVAPSFNSGPGEIKMIAGAGPALKKIQALGYLLIAVSDQSAVGRGYSTKDHVCWAFDELGRQLAAHGVHLDGYYFTEGAGESGILPEFRHRNLAKPDSGQIIQAAREFNLDLTHCFMIGDRITDVRCALNAGITPFLVRTGFGKKAEEKLNRKWGVKVFDGLGEAADFLERAS